MLAAFRSIVKRYSRVMGCARAEGLESRGRTNASLSPLHLHSRTGATARGRRSRAMLAHCRPAAPLDCACAGEAAFLSVLLDAGPAENSCPQAQGTAGKPSSRAPSRRPSTG